MDECREHAHSEMIYGMLPVVLMGCSSRVGASEMDVFQRRALVGCRRLNREHARAAPTFGAPVLSCLLSFVRRPGRQMEDLIYPLAPEREQLSPLRNIWRQNNWPQAWLLQVTPTVYRSVAGRISEHGDNVKEEEGWQGRVVAPKQCPLCHWVTDASFQRVRWTAAHSLATTIPILQQMNVHPCS